MSVYVCYLLETCNCGYLRWFLDPCLRREPGKTSSNLHHNSSSPSRYYHPAPSNPSRCCNTSHWLDFCSSFQLLNCPREITLVLAFILSMSCWIRRGRIIVLYSKQGATKHNRKSQPNQVLRIYSSPSSFSIIRPHLFIAS